MSEEHIECLCKDFERLAKPQTSLETPPVAPAGLLRLPLEIRLQIYRYCVFQNRSVEITRSLNDRSWHANENKNSILFLSKQISEEALDILYGENVFKMHLNGGGEAALKDNFTKANAQRMRYLLVVARPMGVSYGPEDIPDDALWSAILPHLKWLRIVAEQPLEAGHYYNAPTLEQDLDHWFKWIRPFLVCFSQHLLGQTVVEVDDDGRTDTRKLVEECLGNGYRKVQCHRAGDFIFKRGQFSLESGYWDDEDDGHMGSWDA